VALASTSLFRLNLLRLADYKSERLKMSKQILILGARKSGPGGQLVQSLLGKQGVVFYFEFLCAPSAFSATLR
jgi:hypothetical protein